SFGYSKLFDVREAYAVAQGSGFTFTAGKFTTYQGIEVVDGWLNPTITRGYLYYLAEPVTHVGAKLHYTTNMFDVGVGVVNGWDTNNGYFTTGDNNPQKTLIWRAAVTPVPQFFAAFSGTYGVEKFSSSVDPRLSMDLTGAVTPLPNLVINFQGNYGSEKKLDWVDGAKSASWLGFGLQPVLKINAFQIGARFEIFQDKGLSRTYGFSSVINPKAGDGTLEDPSNTKNKVSLWTLGIAPGYTIANALLLRTEFRVDGANEEVLWGGKKTQSSLAFSAAYYF
ncbi:MAG TPA: outer membrane beta-barrel protein, partial [Polyangiaceae bacterium]|nr:outer membrane beta-barrel protein [Polyangiaceae bacterium]